MVGQVDLEFLVCKTVTSWCTDLKTYKNNTIPIKVLNKNLVSQKEIYELEISNEVIRKINQVEEQVNIVVKMQKVKREKKEGEKEVR